ncbi:hypothetical protein OG21DRAFT_1488885 [Imleria badia]|nr:hypothetical protein OG21DRAFT_1488885 [Imleria badia]
MHPSSHAAPLPTYQASTQGLSYGFNTEGTSSQEPLFTAPRSQAPVVSAAARHGSITPTLHRSTPQTFNVISSRSRSGTPSSQSGSMAPASWNVSTAPTSRSGSATRVSGMSSQVLQRVCLPLTRTYSAHSLKEMTYQLQDSFASEPPPYRSRNGNGIPGGNSNNFSGSQLHREASYQLNELFIDELSPDEDELAAVKALQEPNGLPNVRHIPDDSDIDPALLMEEHDNSGNGAHPVSRDHDTDPAVSIEEHSDHGIAHDVVNEHHQRNRFPRPPDPSTLQDVRLQQQHSNARCQNHAHINNGVPSTFISIPRCPPQALSAPSQAVPAPSQAVPAPPQAPSVDVPPGPLDGSATKLHAYPLGFRTVIERAKLIAQCNAASNDPFMPRSQCIEEKCFEFFNEALAETQNVPQGYWPQYRKELSVLVWEAMMTWHSTLKSKAQEPVPHFYALGDEILPLDNKTQAQVLICGSVFTLDGVDEEGSTNNMAAPALSALISLFFYNGPSSLAAIFPDVFSGEVPQVTVCLAVTVLRAAIDEYPSTGIREDRKFEYQGYSKIYAQFYLMQCTINENPRHCAKTQELRVLWATSADVPANDPSNIIPFEDDFQPILD